MSQAGPTSNQGATTQGIQTITGNDSVAVGPDISSNINLIGSGGVTVSGDAVTNTLTIAVSVESITWNAISTSQTLVINNGYICSGGDILSLALPAVSSLGDIIEITLDGSSGFTITQGAGQKIRLGNQATTAGVGGTLSSTAQGDSLRMVCSVANNNWNVLSCIGNPTIA